MVLHQLIMFSVIVGEGPRVIMEGNAWGFRTGRGAMFVETWRIVAIPNATVFSVTVEWNCTLEGRR